MTEPTDNEAAVGLVEVGGRLRAAREQAGMSVTEVAAQLRLRPQLLDALEHHRSTDLPPPTYVAGYIRAYARLLGLPAEELVARYEETTQVAEAVIKATKPSESPPPVKLIAAAIGVILVALSVVWWLGREPKKPAPVATVAEQSTAPAAVQHVSPGEAVPLTLPPPAPASTASTPDASTPAAPEQAVAATAPEPKPQPPAPPPLTDQMPQASLALHFNADSWAELSDAAGRQLLYGLYHAGEDRVVQGQAPFKVFLGYAKGVVVQYNGKAFDPSPYIRNNIARFRVGRDADNRPLKE